MSEVMGGKLLPSSSSLSKMLLGMVEVNASLMLKPLSCSEREAVGGPPAVLDGLLVWPAALDTVAEAPPGYPVRLVSLRWCLAGRSSPSAADDDDLLLDDLSDLCFLCFLSWRWWSRCSPL